MALNKEMLSTALFNAEIDGTTLTSDAREKVKKKCDVIAKAIDDFVKSADVVVDIPPLAVATAGGPGTTSPGQGLASNVF